MDVAGDIFPSPLEMLARPGRLSLKDNVIAWRGSASGREAAAALAEDNSLSWTERADAEGTYTFTCGRPVSLPMDRLAYVQQDGYLLSIGPEGLAAAANSDTGLFYALDTLCQLIDQDRALPCAEIVDRPTSPHRGVMIDLARVVERPDYVASLFPFLSRCRINQIYLYLENKLALRCAPELAHPCAWTAEELSRVIEEARSWHIDVIPMLATLGHMESILKHPAYAPLAEPHTADHLAIHRPEAQAFLLRVVDEICFLFPSRFVHLGGDECPYLSRSLSGPDRSPGQAKIQSYALGMNLLRDRLREHRKRPIIWADMVLQHPALLDHLSRDFILIHWHYGPAHKQETVEHRQLAKQGFDVGVAPAILADEPFLPLVDRLERNIPYLSRSTELWGTITCLWEPRTQTLPVAKIGMAIAGACAWNPFILHPRRLLKQASLRVYGQDISSIYQLLADGAFYNAMQETRLGYYHAFELTCNHPMVLWNQPDDPMWSELSGRLQEGLRQLNACADLARHHPTDHQAFHACAHLALYLAQRQAVMRRGGTLYRDANATPDAWARYGDDLRNLADLAQQALVVQTDAWLATRRSEDDNFDWWFTEPLSFQRQCLLDLAEQVESLLESNAAVEFDDREYLHLNITKGAAPAWNLLRLRISYSWDGQAWTQMFFRTIPLWMEKGVDLDLMPRNEMPRYIRIEPSCWCWHDSDDWSDMICWELRRLPAARSPDLSVDTWCADAAIDTHAEYQLDRSDVRQLHLRLVVGAPGVASCGEGRA